MHRGPLLTFHQSRAARGSPPGDRLERGVLTSSLARLGLPTTIVYESGRGWESMQLPAELHVIGQQVDLQGQWLRRPA